MPNPTTETRRTGKPENRTNAAPTVVVRLFGFTGLLVVVVGVYWKWVGNRKEQPIRENAQKEQK